MSIIVIWGKHKGENHIFIKAVVFQHFGISWLIRPKTQLGYDFYKYCTHWIKNVPWYNKTIYAIIIGSPLRDFFVANQQYSFLSFVKLMLMTGSIIIVCIKSVVKGEDLFPWFYNRCAKFSCCCNKFHLVVVKALESNLFWFWKVY